MAIPVVHEPPDVVFGKIERCHFCLQRTRYWHENTDNPVCPQCAKKYKVAALPDHGQVVRRLKRQCKWRATA